MFAARIDGVVYTTAAVCSCGACAHAEFRRLLQLYRRTAMVPTLAEWKTSASGHLWDAASPKYTGVPIPYAHPPRGLRAEVAYIYTIMHLLPVHPPSTTSVRRDRPGHSRTKPSRMAGRLIGLLCSQLAIECGLYTFEDDTPPHLRTPWVYNRLRLYCPKDTPLFEMTAYKYIGGPRPG